MLYELALISVLVAGGYWGLYFARSSNVRTYGLMLLGAAALSGLALLGRKYDMDSLGIAGAIGVGMGTCLLVVGPMARVFARRAAASERFGLAQRLLDVAEVLAPGSGVAEEKDVLAALRALRDGNIERTVDALRDAKDRAPAEARVAIDERIAMLYLHAYRWDEAIAHAEAHLFDALPTDPTPSPGSLRRALGMTPPVYVELLGAYGYKGDLDRAAAMLARLEAVCAGREDAAIWLHRGRTIFLALAGRVDAVQTLVAPRRSRHMTRAARTYWIAVAHERKGENDAAAAAYLRARAKSRGRPRMLVDEALKRLGYPMDTDEDEKPVIKESKPYFKDRKSWVRIRRNRPEPAPPSEPPVPVKTPIELGPTAMEVVTRVEASPPPAVKTVPRQRGPIATRFLIAGVLGVAVATQMFLGSSGDVGVLVRAGAMVRTMIHAGEWWRLVSCIFVHVGAVHLLVNTIGLFFLGRLAEELFGGWRTAAVFAISGLAGSAASYLASPAGISAGASGAIFGILGAVFIELITRRRHHRAAWSRGVMGAVALVVVAQLGIDFVEPMTDQWAHFGGLVAGVIVGLVLSPHARWHWIALQIARLVSITFLVVCVMTMMFIANTPIADSIERGGATPGFLEIERTDATVDQVVERDLKTPDGTKATLTDDKVVALPAGWFSKEIVTTSNDELDNRQVTRTVVARRPDGVVVRLETADTVARWAPYRLAQMLARQ